METRFYVCSSFIIVRGFRNIEQYIITCNNLSDIRNIEAEFIENGINWVHRNHTINDLCIAVIDNPSYI